MTLNVTDTESGSAPKSPYCHFCQTVGHSSTRCNVYDTVDARKRRLNALKTRCGTCFLKKHNGACLKLKCQKCQGSHWVALCDKFGSQSNNSNTTVNLNINANNPVALPTLNIPVRNNLSENIQIRTLLDQGSQCSLILSDLAKSMGLKEVSRETMCLKGFAGETGNKAFPIVNIEVDFGYTRKTLKVVVVQEFPSIATLGLAETYSDLSSYKFKLAPNSIQDKVCLLIGSDYFYTIVNPNRTVIRRKGVNLLPTYFGLVPTGKLKHKVITDSSNVTVLNVNLNPSITPWGENIVSPTDTVELDINKIWELDSLGIRSESYEWESDKVLDKFDSTIKYDGSKYEVHLPWKTSPLMFPTNFALAKARLQSMLSKSCKNTLMIDNYQKVLDDQEEKGFIERIPSNEINTDHAHYIPHRGIIRDHPTTPLRIVFDCSAHASKNDKSLNDCLYNGPQLVPELTKVLLRIRLGSYLCISDISKAFLQVGITPKDRDYLRFLWVKDVKESVYSTNNLIFYRFCVVLFGATSSPFLLQATIRYHLNQYGNSSGYDSELSRNLYVDNLHYCTDDEQSLIQFFHVALDCYQKAGLPLREWISNSPLFNKLIKEKNLGPKEEPDSVKVLGLNWCISKDELSLKVPSIRLDVVTKRSALSNCAKLFDPMGFVNPITIQSRIFLQTFWRADYG